MNKNVNIAIVGLGQIGIYLYNELIVKKKDIETKTGKKINIVAISAKNKNKKRRFKINKKIFYQNPLEIFKKQKIDILFESIGLPDGISKNIVETALKNKIHVITPNKALIAKHGDYLSLLAKLSNEWKHPKCTVEERNIHYHTQLMFEEKRRKHCRIKKSKIPYRLI